MKRAVEDAMAERKKIITVSLDIANAFNSVSFTTIRKAMRQKRFSTYLCRVVKNYLQDRYIVFTNSLDEVCRRCVLASSTDPWEFHRDLFWVPWCGTLHSTV